MKARPQKRIILVLLIFVTTWLVPMVATSASTTKHSEGVTFRAVLCFAPLRATPSFSTLAALPDCKTAFRLTVKNLGVNPNNSVQGFAMKTVTPDPRFREFPNSSSAVHSLTSDLLLSRINGTGPERFVLGPARVTSSSIKSAKAVKQSLGQWVVTYQLTKAGAVAMNAFLKSQFHAFIAIVANGQVFSAPIIQPTRSHFTSFGRSGEVSGNFTKRQAQLLARQMLTANS